MAKRTTGRDNGRLKPPAATPNGTPTEAGEGAALACPAVVASNPRAAAIWRDTVAGLPPGRGGAVFSRMLGEYCLAVARSDEAAELLRSDNPEKTKLIVASGAKGGGAKRSPLLDIVREQSELARKIAADLGLMGGPTNSDANGAQRPIGQPYNGSALGRRGVAPRNDRGDSGAAGGLAGTSPGAPEGAEPRSRGGRPLLLPSQGGQNPVYTSPAGETFETQADFARRHGVSRPAVGKWKERGFLVLQGDKVDVRASDANLKANGLGRFKDADEALTGAETGDAGLQPAGGGEVYTDGADPIDFDTAAAFLQNLMEGKFATAMVAGQVKENALAGVRVLEFLKAAGSLIELEAVEKVFFEQARAIRNEWMQWPADIGPRLAAELGLSAETVTEALTRHVHQKLADMGEPDPEFAAEPE